ncbi:MAG: hypothetical protein L0Y68_00085 [Candidatus Dadabacteria bacterium]|nr:hypothetical protein [Candidatus Dadabacteria bacterium]
MHPLMNASSAICNVAEDFSPPFLDKKSIPPFLKGDLGGFHRILSNSPFERGGPINKELIK